MNQQYVVYTLDEVDPLMYDVAANANNTACILMQHILNDITFYRRFGKGSVLILLATSNLNFSLPSWISGLRI